MATGPAVDEWETISGGDDEWETIGPSVADQARQRLASRGLTPDMVKAGQTRGAGEMRPATMRENVQSVGVNALTGALAAPATGAALALDASADVFSGGPLRRYMNDESRFAIPTKLTDKVGEVRKGAASAIKEAVGVPQEAITDVADSIGNSVGEGGAAFAGPAVAGAAKQGLKAATAPARNWLSKEAAPRMMNSTIKATKSMFKFGSNPGDEIAGLKFNSPEELIPQLEQKMIGYENQLNQMLATPQGRTRAIHAEALVRRAFNEPIAVAKRNGRAEMVTSLEAAMNARVEAIRNVTKGRAWVRPDEAQAIKKQIGHDTRWVQGADDTARTLNDALQDAYVNLDKAIDSAVPAAKALNRKYANAITAKKAAEAMVQENMRQDPVSLLSPLTWANHPAVRSRIAAAIK